LLSIFDKKYFNLEDNRRKEYSSLYRKYILLFKIKEEIVRMKI